MHRSARAALEIGRFPRYTCEVSHPLPGPRGATPEPPAALYKVCPRSSWSEALSLGALPPSAADARDGYVHLSAAHQVRATLERHFARQPDLVLLRGSPWRPPHDDHASLRYGNQPYARRRISVAKAGICPQLIGY